MNDQVKNVSDVIKEETAKNYEPGASVSGLENIEFLSELTADDLKKQLQAIKTPINIVAFYGTNNRHFVWFTTSKPVKKVRRVTKKK